MSSWLKRQGLDQDKAIIIGACVLLDLNLGVIARPILILALTASVWSWLTFFAVVPARLVALRVGTKIVTLIAGSGRYLETDQGTTIVLDVIRGLIQGTIEAVICILAFAIIVLFLM
jgi:hypothetical protein